MLGDDVKIKVGSLDVLESGMVHSNGSDPISFTLSDDMFLRLEVDFNRNESPSIELKPEGGNTLVMRYINPGSQLHFGPQSPVVIGTLDGRKLLCVVRINTFGDNTSYSADYTFLLGEAV